MNYTYLVVGLVCLSVLPACSSTSEVMKTSPPDNVVENTASIEDAERLEALFNERRQQAKMRFVDADVDFMHGMIAHHAQALVMSSFCGV